MRTVVTLLLLVTLEYSAYLSLVPSRPSSADRFEKALPGGSFANVIGQSGYWQVIYGVCVVVMVYCAKTAIVYYCASNRIAIISYTFVLLLCLPILWLFVTTDWNNAHAELAYWLTLPIGLLTVPTLGLIIDLGNRPYRCVRLYGIKTFIELFLVPVWLYVWVLMEFVLGFYWI